MKNKAKDHNPHPRVLITGGAGFIGSHLAEALLNRGCQVTIIDDLSTGNFDNVAHLVPHPEFKYAIDTINNEGLMDRMVSECEMVYHLAAAVGVHLIVEKPIHTNQINIMGTEIILRTSARYGVKVLVTSSSEVYGRGNNVPFSENDDVVLGPTVQSRWSYAASKMVDEFMALAYFREKGLPVVIVRLFNTIGPRQVGHYGMVVPRFIGQALRGEQLTVYGDGQQSRCFLDIRDAVRALIVLAEEPKAVGQVFNVGSIQEVTIFELACKVLQTVGREAIPENIAFMSYDQAYMAGFEDMRRRVPDISKIRDLIGWEPQYTLEQALEHIVAGYEAQIG
ncbi:MAG: GDP-mannose 4,6-dehydratase [Chloroflexota bacterium]